MTLPWGMVVALGPVPCQECKRPVVLTMDHWNERTGSWVFIWRTVKPGLPPSSSPHRCQVAPCVSAGAE
jgi:hypothetical protein